MADKILQNDILSSMIIIDPNSGNKPFMPQVISQKVLKVTNNQKTGQWKEIWEEWQVKWSAKEGAFIIKLVPASDGGVDFTIIPKQVAEKQGVPKELLGSNP